MSKYGKLLSSTLKHLKALGSGASGSSAVASKDKKALEPSKSQKKISLNLAKIVDLLSSSEGRDDKLFVPFDKPDSPTSPSEPPPTAEKLAAELNELSTGLVSGDLPLLLFSRMQSLAPEDNKNIQHIYQFLFRNKRAETVKYVIEHPQIIHQLVLGYNNKPIALTCGALLREFLRDEQINNAVLASKDMLEPFFDFVQGESFDTSADAFETFKMILTKHPKACGKWLQDNSANFLSKYNVLIKQGGYITKRQALKLLGELITSRANFHFMMSYINDSTQLELIITCFTDPQKAIKFEAFHVFKIFVANPRKTPQVIEVLQKEKPTLENFIKNFDWLKFKEQFSEEKAMITKVLAALPPISTTTTTTTSTTSTTSSSTTSTTTTTAPGTGSSSVPPAPASPTTSTATADPSGKKK